MKFVYAVRDNVANLFLGQLLIMVSDSVAIRAFGDTLADPNGMMAKHPADYDLYKLGEFKEEVGIIAVPNLSELIITGIACNAIRDSK